MKRMGNIRILVILIGLPCFTAQASVDPVIITNPKPTHFEKNIIDLKVVKHIPADFSPDFFFGEPSDLLVAGDGAIFVFDRVVNKIFKFDKNYKFLKGFGTSGQGPCEWGKDRHFLKRMHITDNGKLYLGDVMNSKIIEMSLNGDCVKEFSFLSKPGIQPFIPIADKKGNFILVFSDGIGVVNPSTMERGMIVPAREYLRYLLHAPWTKKINPRTQSKYILDEPNASNTQYNWIAPDTLAVYLSHSSTVFIFKNYREIKRFDVWPEKALLRFEKWMERLKKRAVERFGDESFGGDILQFTRLVPDLDLPGTFFLQGSDPDTHKPLFYHFNSAGTLIELFRSEVSIQLTAKRNGLFYGFVAGDTQTGVIILERRIIK